MIRILSFALIAAVWQATAQSAQRTYRTPVYAGDTPDPGGVAHFPKPAVSPTSKSALLLCDERVWKPATRQTWKSALRCTDPCADRRKRRRARATRKHYGQNRLVLRIRTASIKPWSVNFNSGMGDKLKKESVMKGAASSQPKARAAALRSCSR